MCEEAPISASQVVGSALLIDSLDRKMVSSLLSLLDLILKLEALALVVKGLRLKV